MSIVSYINIMIMGILYIVFALLLQGCLTEGFIPIWSPKIPIYNHVTSPALQRQLFEIKSDTNVKQWIWRLDQFVLTLHNDVCNIRNYNYCWDSKHWTFSLKQAQQEKMRGVHTLDYNNFPKTQLPNGKIE